MVDGYLIHPSQGECETRPYLRATLANDGRPVVIESGALEADEGEGQSFLAADSVPRALKVRPRSPPSILRVSSALKAAPLAVQLTCHIAFRSDSTGGAAWKPVHNS